MGEFDDWDVFERERATAGQITNRRTARSVAAQIGRRYRTLSVETEKFISENFTRCDFNDLASLCDAIPAHRGLYLRLDKFEKKFFPLSERIKSRFPFYAHVSISLYGLTFEFPEHHFLRDLESAFKSLSETQSQIGEFRELRRDPKKQRDKVAELIARENFLSRSITSATFSLVEAFLSGIFFTAIHTGSFGLLKCDDNFLEFARKKERAALKDRLNRVVKFASQGQATGDDNPFQSFITFGKMYRDAIHHTTPFERPNLEAGKRLEALYKIDGDIALQCALYSLDTVLKFSCWAYGDTDPTVIATECRKLKDEALRLLESK